jgi:hypothetical protein
MFGGWNLGLGCTMGPESSHTDTHPNRFRVYSAFMMILQIYHMSKKGPREKPLYKKGKNPV